MFCLSYSKSVQSVFMTRVTRRAPLVEQVLFTLPVHTRVQPLFSLGSCSSFSSLCGGLRVIVCLVIPGFYFLWAIMLYILQLRATDYPSNLSWFVLVKYNILFLKYLEKATLQNIEQCPCCSSFQFFVLYYYVFLRSVFRVVMSAPISA